MKAGEARAVKRGGGDERSGFDVQIEPEQRLVVMRAWGFWGVPLAQESVKTLLVSYKEISVTRTPWYFLVDHRKFPAQSGEVQAVISTTIRDATKLGMRRSASVLDSTITKLQIRRLTSTSGLPMDVFAFFNSEDQARKWLLKT